MMYDENKWNENEKNESSEVISDGTVEALDGRAVEKPVEKTDEKAAEKMEEKTREKAEVVIDAAEETCAADMRADQSTVVDSNAGTTGTDGWSKSQSGEPENPNNASNQTYGQYPYGQNRLDGPQNRQYGSCQSDANQNRQYGNYQSDVNQNRQYGNYQSDANQNRQYGNYQSDVNQNRQYGNYQSDANQNRQYSNYQSNANRNHQPYQSYQHYKNPNSNSGYGSQNPKKKGGVLKKAVLVTAGALFFGVVSGATMFGVNRVANLLFPMQTQVQTEAQIQQETQAALGNTQTIPDSQETAAASATATGVVIEDVSPIVEAAMPSVVAINNTTLYQSSTWFGQTQTYEVPSSGSGIIVGENDTELLIVTNHHVIEDSNTLTVTFIDESTVNAAIKGTDSESDLAVIAVPLDQIAADTKAQIKAATIGDSDTLKMGQGVIAIGNALGLGQSVTVGHVSALDREVTVDGVTRTVIQTDAAINPGNSGGALLNAKGELIGINEAKYASESVEGVGYAIPISHAMGIIEDLKLRTTKVEVAESEQGYLGIQVQNVDSSTAKMLGMPEGVYIYKIMEDSAAAASDLREKDIITKFDGETVKNNADLTGLLAYYKAGTTVTITVQSLENGTYVERQVEVTLKNRPDDEENKTQGSQETRAQRP